MPEYAAEPRLANDAGCLACRLHRRHLAHHYHLTVEAAVRAMQIVPGFVHAANVLEVDLADPRPRDLHEPRDVGEVADKAVTEQAGPASRTEPRAESQVAAAHVAGG